MIKAKATLSHGRPLYLFGLSQQNLEKLREGMPIRIHLEEMGGEGEVLIMFGETEHAIAAELAEMIGPNTDVRGLDKMGN